MDYIFLDLETTCWKNNIDKREVIEIGIILFDIKTKSYHQIQRYIKPINNWELSDYCKDLTGISQEQINESIDFKTNIFEIKDIIETIVKKPLNKVTYLSWGESDKKILETEFNLHNIEYCFGPFINFKEIYSKHCGFDLSLKKAVSHAKLNFYGKQHSAIDDAMNLLYLFDFIKTNCPYHLPFKIGEPLNA